MENASSEMKSAARSFMDARELVAQVKSARALILSRGWSGCFRRLAINDITCFLCNEGFRQRKGNTSVKNHVVLAKAGEI